jgi:hypothetical protein
LPDFILPPWDTVANGLATLVVPPAANAIIRSAIKKFLDVDQE